MRCFYVDWMSIEKALSFLDAFWDCYVVVCIGVVYDGRYGKT